MIVISGALVLVALVLLVIGLISPDLAFVYASIGVSLASFAFLVVGILQRRKEDVSGETADAVVVTDSSTSGLGVRRGDKGLDRDDAVTSEGVTTLPPAYKAPRGAAEPTAGTVLVVAGRPRYHVEGCRYLSGKEADEVEVVDAREEGFTACGVCKPDENLTAPGPQEVAAETSSDSEGPDQATAAGPRGGKATAATRTAAATTKKATAPAKTAAATTKKATPPSVSKAAAVAAPVRKAAPTKAAPPRTAAPAKAAAAKAAPIKAAKAAPPKASPAKKAAAAPVKRGGVIVIPDRGKYHTPDCRYVRGAEDTLELTKAQANRQGYDACGVCNP